MEGDCLCEAGDAVCVCLSVFVCPDVPDEEWPDDVAVLFHEVFEGDDASVVECAHHADCVNMLESYGVPAVILHPGDGDFGKVVLGMSGTGSSIFVPETMYEMAVELMEAEPDDELQNGV